MTQPREFKASLTRLHYMQALEGTNNTLFYFASSAPIEDQRMKFPPQAIAALGLPPNIRTMFDYRTRFPGIYNRVMQFCVISLCSDIEFFFKDLFGILECEQGRGTGFFQRIDDVLKVLAKNGMAIDDNAPEIAVLKRAFAVRHLCVHNLGIVDAVFISKTNLAVAVGSTYTVETAEYREMFDAFVTLLKTFDQQLAAQ